MKPRTRARSVALQVLYEVDIANHPPADVFKARLEETPLSEELSEFTRQIIFGVLPLTSNLDILNQTHFIEHKHTRIVLI